MRFADPYALRMKTPRETLVFAASSRAGNESSQRNYFLNFNDECFVVADGSDKTPHGATAAKFASETAIWGFKHIRQRPYYWQDKKKLIKRIFRSTNLAVWQKQREQGFEEGLMTALLVCIIGAKTYWLGIKGDMGAWLISGNTLNKLSPELVPFSDEANRILGTQRLGIVPYFTTGELRADDVLVLASSGCANYLTAGDLETAAGLIGTDTDGATRAVESLLTQAQMNGSTDNMTAVVMKRVATR